MTVPPGLLQRAIALHQAGKLAEAEPLYRQYIAATPWDAAPRFFLGMLQSTRGQAAEAERTFTEGILLSPENPDLLLQRGMVRRALEKNSDAILDFTQAIRINPKLGEAHHQLGNLLKLKGRLPDAITSLRKATKLEPSNAAFLLNLGIALFEFGELADAIGVFRLAISLEPRPEALNILGAALIADHQLSAATLQLNEALRLRPDYAAAHDNLGRCFRNQGIPDHAISHLKSALHISPTPATFSNLLYTLNFLPDIERAEIAEWHRKWGKKFAPSTVAHPLLYDHKRIRIGFVSPDFCHHAVSYFFEPLLLHRDREVFEFFCYSNVLQPDSTTDRFRALSDHWKDIARASDDEAAAAIGQDEIDVLVDLAGHTARNRLLLFAKRPAAIQLTWLGYPNTTGLESIDYRLTNALTDPTGSSEAFYTEKLVRFPDGFSCYQPPPQSPAPAPTPAVAAGHITFGSFAHLSKLNPAVIKLWARVLNGIPGSALFLKAHALIDEGVRENLINQFEGHGVSRERIRVAWERQSLPAHLAGYGEIDIALDPFPYSGTTTTCEALWMGVPVVTLVGQTHASRVTSSILTNIGHPEWSAERDEKYIHICQMLADNLEYLVSNRSQLREQMLASPMCNGPLFARQFELAVKQLLETHHG